MNEQIWFVVVIIFALFALGFSIYSLRCDYARLRKLIAERIVLALTSSTQPGNAELSRDMESIAASYRVHKATLDFQAAAHMANVEFVQKCLLEK